MSLSYKILGQKIVSYTLMSETTETPGASGYGYYGYGAGGSIGDQGTQGYEEFLPITVYTVPVEKQTTVTSIFVANHDNTDSTYDLAVVPAGEELSLKHHIRWDMAVAGKDFENISTKITMSAGDKLVIFPSTVDTVSITAFGVEK
jgi:hypothetical protein